MHEDLIFLPGSDEELEYTQGAEGQGACVRLLDVLLH